jgi:site-specific recombinase XerD
VTRLRKLMLEELQRRNYSESTIRGYLRAVQGFAKHFDKSPDRLGPEELRQYQVYLLREKKLTPGGVEARMSALRFLYVRTLRRHEMREHLPFPKLPRKLPVAMSQQEVAKVIDSARNLLQRTILMVLYSTGARRAELLGDGGLHSRTLPESSSPCLQFSRSALWSARVIGHAPGFGKRSAEAASLPWRRKRDSQCCGQ